MTFERLSRRARLRSWAILEPYQTALRYLATDPCPIKVIPRATADQALLEGRLFLAMRNLHAPKSHIGVPGVMEIFCLRPEPNRLFIKASPLTASTIAHRAFPEADPGSNIVTTGIPGLRIADIGDGTEITRLGHAGSVVFSGITAEQIHRDHRKWLVPHDCPTFDAPFRRTPSEYRAEPYPLCGVDNIFDIDELQVVSSVLRRIGLLRRWGATSIDTWLNRPGRLAVEVFLPHLSREQYFSLVDSLTSPWLTPQWQYVKPRRTSAPEEEYHNLFNISGGECELDLRFHYV